MKNETLHHHPKFGEFSSYLKNFQSSLHDILVRHPEIETRNHLQGLSAYLVRKIHETTPLSVFIPEECGGWGGRPKESLSLVEAAAYESLSVGLTFGIEQSFAASTFTDLAAGLPGLTNASVAWGDPDQYGCHWYWEG